MTPTHHHYLIPDVSQQVHHQQCRFLSHGRDPLPQLLYGDGYQVLSGGFSWECLAYTVGDDDGGRVHCC